MACPPFIAKENDPRLKFILRLVCTEDEELEKEITAKFQAGDATAEDYLAAAWLTQRMKKSAETIAHLTQALRLTDEADARLPIENAILYHAQLLLQQEPGTSRAAAVRAQARELLQPYRESAQSDVEKFQLAQVMNAVGMAEEARAIQEALRAAQVRKSNSHSPSPAANPYSRYRPSTPGAHYVRKTPEKLLQDGHRDLAVNEFVRTIRTLIRQTLVAQDTTEGHRLLRGVISQATELKLWDDVLRILHDTADSGWRSRLEYAVMLEHVGHSAAPALAEHRAVLTLNPFARESQVRLAVLLAYEGKFDEAAACWHSLPTMLQERRLPAVIQEFTRPHQHTVFSPLALSGLLKSWLIKRDPQRVLSENILRQFHTALDYLQQSDGDYPSLYQPFRPNSFSGQQQWKFRSDGTLDLDEANAKRRAVRIQAHNELCRAMFEVPELALTAFPALAGVAHAEGDASTLSDLESTALGILNRLSMPKMKRLHALYGFNGSGGNFVQAMQTGFGSGDKIPMPHPAMFATYTAALSGDQQRLDGVVFPAILKAGGTDAAEYCRAYALLLTAEDEAFVSAAKTWLKLGRRGPEQDDPRHEMLEKVVRLWQTRKLKVSLEPLFLFLDADMFNASTAYIPEAMNLYILALEQSDPAALRTFTRRLRDRWIGDTSELRARNIASWLASQSRKEKGGRSEQISRTQQAVNNYTQWLQRMLLPPHSLALFDVSTEDGLDRSPEWLHSINCEEVERVRSHTPEEFVSSAGFLGFLNEASSFRAREVFTPGRQLTHVPWLSNFVLWYRAQLDAQAINATLALLGMQKPTLGAHVLQALLVKDFSTPLQLDGKSIPFDSTVVTRYHTSVVVSSEFVSAALETVLRHHSKDLATMTDTGRRELSAILRFQLIGYPQPELLGEEFTRILAPVLKTEHSEVIREVDQVLAAKTWSDISQKEYQFARQFPVLLRDLAPVDIDKTQVAARHAFALLLTSPEHKKAMLQNNSTPPEVMFLQELGKAPKLVGTTIAIAAEVGLKKDIHWAGGIFSQAQEALRDPIQTTAIFTGTPWVADTDGFCDLPSGDSVRPTLIATLVERIESDPSLPALLLDHLAKQPATFGTKLCLAFLNSGPKVGTYAHSFYSDRPADAPLVAFMRKHGADFARLKPDAAALLFTLLSARMPDLRRKMQRDPALQKALRPLDETEARQFEAELNRWLSAGSVSELYKEPNQIHWKGPSLLDRVASTNKGLAVRLLDHVSRLLAQRDAQDNRGNQQPPHQTSVANWLKGTAGVPELFGEIMHRAEECGAAKNPAWLRTMLSKAENLYPLRDTPERVMALVESAGLLNSAATFTPHPLPEDSQHGTLLQTIGRQIPGNTKLIEELSKRQPRTFGGDMLLLLGGPHSREDIASFAKTYAAEIAAASAEQKKMLTTLSNGCTGWKSWCRWCPHCVRSPLL